jgi:hypothetical protein
MNISTQRMTSSRPPAKLPLGIHSKYSKRAMAILCQKEKKTTPLMHKNFGIGRKLFKISEVAI